MPRENLENIEENFDYEEAIRFANMIGYIRMGSLILREMNTIDEDIRQMEYENYVSYSIHIKESFKSKHIEIVELFQQQERKMNVEKIETDKLKYICESSKRRNKHSKEISEYKYRKVSKLSQKGRNRNSKEKRY